MAADDIRRLCDIELNRLTRKLQKELKQDIAGIYTDSLFCDLVLVLGNTSLHLNCCLLLVRANSFYTQLCSLEKQFLDGCNLDINAVETIKTFVRDIYDRDDIGTAESLVVKYLEDIAISPDFDQYATPLTSPSQIFEKEKGSSLKTAAYPCYYSIVPLDWEKELAEQDFLIESFRSILQEQERTSKSKPPKSSLLNFKNHVKEPRTKSLLDLKRAVEEDILLFQEEDALNAQDELEHNFDCKGLKEIKSRTVKCTVIRLNSEESAETCNECGFFDAEDSCSIYNYSQFDMQREAFQNRMSSNIDMGPDSGLATSAEDIPLDQESGPEVSKSISSSVSSDCCVWDSSTAPPKSDLTSWVDSAPHQDNSGIQADFVDRVLEELVGKSQHKQEDTSSKTDSFGTLGVINAPRHGFFIDASSLLDETEIPSQTTEFVQDSDSINSAYTHQENEDTSLDGICFDITEPQFKKITKAESPLNENDFSEDSEKDDLTAISFNHDFKEQSKCVNQITEAQNSSLDVENFIKDEQCEPPRRDEKPPSLIRSNTFELEREDDRIALLRQEYEKRQGSLIFQRCASQSSGPLSDIGSEQDLNQHYTSLILPDVESPLTSGSMSLFPTHVVEDEIQTPDSLNSDLPEGVSQEKLCLPKIKDVDEGYENEVEPNILECVSSDLTSLPLNQVPSPLFARRKTEAAPILSGAAPLFPPENKPSNKKVRGSHGSSFPSAWVVDISDMTNLPIGSQLQTCEQEEPKSSSSSLGYFVDLKGSKISLEDNATDGIEPIADGKIARQYSDSGKIERHKACEFFVDLKNSSDSNIHLPETTEVSQASEKKLFSMFIDIGDKVRPKAKPDLTSRSRTPLSPFSQKKKISTQCSVTQPNEVNGKQSHSDSGEKGKNATMPSASLQSHPNPENKKNSFFIFIDPDPGSQRGPPAARLPVNNTFQYGRERKHHVRANSVSSVKKYSGSDTSTSAALSSSSRHLSSQSLQNVEMCTDNGESTGKPMFSSCHASLPLDESHEGQLNRSQEEMLECSELCSQMTTGSNESSACSLETYSVHTPEQSSATDDYSSEKKDFCQNHFALKEGMVAEKSKKWNPRHSSMFDKSTLHGGISSRSENNLKTENQSTKSFVRLSDLDKEPVSLSIQPVPPVSHRMSRSIPETSWIERKSLMSQSTGGVSTAMSSSSRSLSRLFPHLSMYGASLGRSKTSSICSALTEDIDAMRSSQISDMSSMQSSAGLECSTESTDISSDRGSPATQLSDDLLKMFLDGINTDVIVDVGGRRIKAHKCILSSRCQYFAAILSGGWVESAGNVISLQGFSYNVVHFALCHIYSGASTIPDQISIVELASFADMLSLEGLKDVITYTLKVKYCHFFHKPCAVCSVGVLECLPLAAAYGLDDIYRKSLRWITKYFVRIWPTKTFTALPRELIDKCFQQHVIHMTAENVMETLLFCDKLLSTIPTVRWAEPVFVLTSRLIETCIKFMSENFCAVLTSDNFLALGRELPWNVSKCEENLVSACERMPPDQSCRSYSQLCSVLDVVQGPQTPPEMTWHPNFVELLIRLQDISERTLIKQAARAARTPGWGQMPTELRRKIQDAACLVLAPADHASSRYKKTISDGLRQSSQRSNYSRNLDLHQVKMAMVQHARKSNSNNHNQSTSSVVVRKNLDRPDQSTALSRRSAPLASLRKSSEKSVSAPTQGRPKTWPAQVKSRYLEKRPNHSKQTIVSQERNKHLDAPVPQRRVQTSAKGIFISSSDSSRNSSPAMRRSSNVSSSNTKSTELATKPRAATTAICKVSQKDVRQSSKEDGVVKSFDNSAKRSLSVNVKNQSVVESMKTPSAVRKVKESLSPDFPSHDCSAKPEGADSLTPSTIGTQSQSITMSNDSLATVSSCDDVRLNHSGKSCKSKCPTVAKINSLQNTTGNHTNVVKKCDIISQRTPLILTNQKASPSYVQRKLPMSSSKPSESNASPSLLMSKRSISHSAKSPVLSSSGSRLAIPLRTSRSVSSVPDKGQANSSSDGLLTRRSIGRNQLRSNVPSTFSKRASTGSSIVSNSSLAGRALSKGNKSSDSGSRITSSKNSDEVNGDNSVDITVHPTVGPRSGTFLKDEPTVLKNPVLENN